MKCKFTYEATKLRSSTKYGSGVHASYFLLLPLLFGVYVGPVFQCCCTKRNQPLVYPIVAPFVCLCVCSSIYTCRYRVLKENNVPVPKHVTIVADRPPHEGEYTWDQIIVEEDSISLKETGEVRHDKTCFSFTARLPAMAPFCLCHNIFHTLPHRYLLSPCVFRWFPLMLAYHAYRVFLTHKIRFVHNHASASANAMQQSYFHVLGAHTQAFCGETVRCRGPQRVCSLRATGLPFTVACAHCANYVNVLSARQL